LISLFLFGGVRASFTRESGESRIIPATVALTRTATLTPGSLTRATLIGKTLAVKS